MSLKVAVVTSSFGTGGAERQAAFVVECLLDAGYEVAPVAIEDGVDFLQADITPSVIGKRSKWDIVRVVRACRRLLFGADLVLCFGWYAAFVCVLSGAGGRCVARFGTSVARLRGAKRLMAAWSVSRCLGAVVTTSGVGAELGLVLSSPRHAIAVIRNAVPCGWVDSLPAPVQASRRYAVCVARLDPVKQHWLLLKAFASVAQEIDHDLVLVGDGPLRADLQALASSIGISERVHFLGFVPDPRGVIAGADFSVLSSASEGYGSVLIEAVALGVPFVACDVPYGPREVSMLSGGGLLVAPGDISELAKGIETMSNDEALRRRMSECCTAKRHIWSPDEVCRLWTQFFGECMSILAVNR